MTNDVPLFRLKGEILLLVVSQSREYAAISRSISKLGGVGSAIEDTVTTHLVSLTLTMLVENIRDLIGGSSVQPSVKSREMLAVFGHHHDGSMGIEMDERKLYGLGEMADCTKRRTGSVEGADHHHELGGVDVTGKAKVDKVVSVDSAGDMFHKAVKLGIGPVDIQLRYGLAILKVPHRHDRRSWTLLHACYTPSFSGSKVTKWKK